MTPQSHALDLAGRRQLAFDAARPFAAARPPGDPVTCLQRFRHAVLRRKLPPQFAGRHKVAGRLAERGGPPVIARVPNSSGGMPSKNSYALSFQNHESMLYIFSADRWLRPGAGPAQAQDGKAAERFQTEARENFYLDCP